MNNFILVYNYYSIAPESQMQICSTVMKSLYVFYSTI